MKRVFLIITIIFVSLLDVLTRPKINPNGENNMTRSCAENSRYMAELEPFPSDISEVERAWGVSIPTELLLIGGVDHFSWARVCHDDAEPEGIYRGAYIDGALRYSGTFRYVHPEGKSAPERLFEDFHMALIENQAIRFHQNFLEPPIEYFYMIPTHPENIQRAE